MSTDILSIDEITEAQGSKYVTHNGAIRQLEGMTIRVLDKDNGGPPGGPSNGDTYIVDSATGDWSGASVKDIAYYYGSAWYFYTPVEGVRIWVNDEDVEYVFDGSDWVELIAPVDITNFDGILSAADTTVQKALDTIDDHLHDGRYYTETETDTWRNGVTQTEMGYVHGITSDLQTQLDARCLESVFGTAISTGLLLDGTDLKVSAVLQVYHGINPSANVQAILGAADYAAILTLMQATLDGRYELDSHLHDGETLECDGINSDGGAFPFTTSGPVTFSNVRVGSHDDITATSEGIAASVATEITFVTTNGDSDLDNVTLADGVEGQIKHIVCISEGNAADTWKITPANMVGGTQITFAGIGEGCTLIFYSTTGWVVTGNNGGTIS